MVYSGIIEIVIGFEGADLRWPGRLLDVDALVCGERNPEKRDTYRENVHTLPTTFQIEDKDKLKTNQFERSYLANDGLRHIR